MDKQAWTYYGKYHKRLRKKTKRLILMLTISLILLSVIVVLLAIPWRNSESWITTIAMRFKNGRNTSEDITNIILLALPIIGFIFTIATRTASLLMIKEKTKKLFNDKLMEQLEEQRPTPTQGVIMTKKQQAKYEARADFILEQLVQASTTQDKTLSGAINFTIRGWLVDPKIKSSIKVKHIKRELINFGIDVDKGTVKKALKLI